MSSHKSELFCQRLQLGILVEQRIHLKSGGRCDTHITRLCPFSDGPDLAMIEVAVEEAEDCQHLLIVQRPVLDQPLDKPDLSVGQNHLRHACLSPLHA